MPQLSPGRPTTYKPETGLALVCAVARGASLRRLHRAGLAPEPRQVARWYEKAPDLQPGVMIAGFVRAHPPEIRERVVARAFRAFVETLGTELLREIPRTLHDQEPVRSFRAWFEEWRSQ